MKRRFLLVALFAVTFVGCRSVRNVTVEKPVYLHDTITAVKVQHDSTYVDRWHTVEVKGDTVYVTERQITSKLVTATDTIYKVVEKPVEVVKEQIKEVPAIIPKWRKFVFFIGLTAIVTFVVWILRRFSDF